jgi:hypothetical protein
VLCHRLWAGRPGFDSSEGKGISFITKFTALMPVELTVHWISLKQFLRIPVPSYTTRFGCGRVRTPYVQNNYKYLLIIVFILLLLLGSIILCKNMTGNNFVSRSCKEWNYIRPTRITLGHNNFLKGNFSLCVGKNEAMKRRRLGSRKMPPRILKYRHQMEVSGQLRTPAALPSCERTLRPSAQEVDWSPEPLWTISKVTNLLSRYEWNPCSSTTRPFLSSSYPGSS